VYTLYPCHLSFLSVEIREGQNAIYQSKLIWAYLQWTSVQIQVLLCHEQEGPCFQVYCRQFKAVSDEQTRLYYKSGSGWAWIPSTPFALLTHEVADLELYVTVYTKFYLAMLGNNESWLTPVFLAARHNSDVRLISRAKLKLVY